MLREASPHTRDGDSSYQLEESTNPSYALRLKVHSLKTLSQAEQIANKKEVATPTPTKPRQTNKSAKHPRHRSFPPIERGKEGGYDPFVEKSKFRPMARFFDSNHKPVVEFIPPSTRWKG
jgi:hypothetical protein